MACAIRVRGDQTADRLRVGGLCGGVDVVVEQRLAQLGDQAHVVLGVEEAVVDAEAFGDLRQDLGGHRPGVVL